jgi:hypothetical protein
MHIRHLAPDDIESAWQINQSNTPAVSSVTLDEFAWLIEVSDLSLAARVDDVMAGFTIVLGPGHDYKSLNYRWFSDRYDNFAYLDRVAVSSSHQRMGIGRAMYEEVLAQLSGKYPVLLLEVNVQPRNETSLAFHEALGFKEVGQQDTYNDIRVSLQELPLQ